METLRSMPAWTSALMRELGVRAQDIEERFTRGTGKGGQKMNKTSSVVVLVHRPTGTSARGDAYRSQALNRRDALKSLLLKIEKQQRGSASLLMREAFKRQKQKARRSRRSKEKMLKMKHHQATIKDLRKPIV